MDFQHLDTTQFQQRMKPAAARIYESVFHGCVIRDLRGKEKDAHILDKEFAVDMLLYLSCGQWLSIQEKYRRHDAMKFMDFTQEYMNADGTVYESPGEWFKLGAQLYFYGWANEEETEFEKWVILDIPKYKWFVEFSGGLDALGQKRFNAKHGKASFYAIPIMRLEPVFFTDYRKHSGQQ